MYFMLPKVYSKKLCVNRQNCKIREISDKRRQIQFTKKRHYATETQTNQSGASIKHEEDNSESYCVYRYWPPKCVINRISLL